MASNISQNTVPSYWSSANDDVIFSFSFKPLLMNGIGNDGNGKAQIVLYGVWDVTPTLGDYIYVSSPLYNGTYKITFLSGSTIATLDTPYIGTIALDTYNCYHLRVPVFTLYKGFKAGDTFENDLPYTKVIDIKPSIIYSKTTGLPYLEINVKSIVKRIFTIQVNNVANSYDFSMFNGIQIVWDGLNTSGVVSEYSKILNCAISTNELIEKYLGTGTYLAPTDKPFIATSGVSFATMFEGFGDSYPVIHKFINGIKQ